MVKGKMTMAELQRLREIEEAARGLEGELEKAHGLPSAMSRPYKLAMARTRLRTALDAARGEGGG